MQKNIYHSALIFHTEYTWLVQYDQSHVVFDYLAEFIHDFRMYGFYVLAGFFFVLVVDKYKSLKALQTRLIRLGVPMLVVGVTLNCVANYVSPNRYCWFTVQYFMDGRWVGHLWFIGNLMIYNLVSILFVSWFMHPKTPRFNKKALYIIIFIVTPLVSLLFAKIGLKFVNGVMDGRNHLLFITFSMLFDYFAFYLLGMLLYSHKHHFKNLICKHTAWLLAILYLITKAVEEQVAVYPTLSKFLALAGSIFLVFAIIGLFNAIARESKILDMYVNSSYTVYLLHQPFIIILFPFVALFNLPPVWSFLIISLSVLFMSHYFHMKFVQSSKMLNFLLNGFLPRQNVKWGQVKNESKITYEKS